jgi:putative hydrolase of the HAD superfamily
MLWHHGLRDKEVRVGIRPLWEASEMGLEAVVFDLGGTLLDWPDWVSDSPRRWGLSHGYLVDRLPDRQWPSHDDYVRAMGEAEGEHWRRVDEEWWSGPPSGLLVDGFRRLGIHIHERELVTALDGYARAVDGWAVVFPDSRSTLEALRSQGLRLGLLSNTWWAAEWHNADLAAHGLADLLDEVVYTSDLSHSKPHPAVFHEVARRLGVAEAVCVMVGDRLVDDVAGAQSAGMRGIWKANDRPWPRPPSSRPDAEVRTLSELPGLLGRWRQP